MCEKRRPEGSGCQTPDECKGHAGECSAEQIKKCHGDVTQHPCVDPVEES